MRTAPLRRKKRHKRENDPLPCIPPEIVVSGKRFPPKTFPGPPWRRIPMQAFRESFILSGSSPDSVILQDRTAYAGEGIAPLFTVYYTMVRAGKQMEKPRRTRKKTARRAFFAGWSNLPVKFCVRNVGTPGRSAGSNRTAWANEGGGQRAGGGQDGAADANRVGGCPLVGQPSSHTTVRAVRHTAVQQVE